MCKNINRLALTFVYKDEWNHDKSSVEVKEASHILFEKNKAAKNYNLKYTKYFSPALPNYIPLVHDKPITSLALVYNTFIYIPFNPGVCEETDNYAWQELQTEKTKQTFYVLPEMDIALKHEFPCGKKIPLYRWAQRHWLFTLFDKGIQIEPDGFMDVTPESVAKHISDKMYSIISCLKDKKAQDAFTDTNVEESKNKTTDCTRIPKECGEICEQFQNQLMMNACDAHSTTEVSQVQPNILLETETQCTIKNNAFNLPLENMSHSSNLLSDLKAFINDLPDELDCVIEACSGFGCNTIQFAKRFQRVIALEKSEARLNMAKQNAALYDVHNIHWFQGDASTILKVAGRYIKNKIGWFFASPPWGGEGYKDKPYFSCCESLGGCNVEELVKEASKYARNIALYLPPHQLTHELIRLAQSIKGCGLVYVENIAIGLKKKIKYKVVYFLEESVIEKFIPGVINTFTKILVHELQEPRHMLEDICSLIKTLGYRKVLISLKNSINFKHKGTIQDTKTKGGMFFFECKNTFGEKYRLWDKERKKLKKKKSKHTLQGSEKSILEKKTNNLQMTNTCENSWLHEKLVDNDLVNNTECIADTPTNHGLATTNNYSPNTPAQNILANKDDYQFSTPVKQDTPNKLELVSYDGIQDASKQEKSASST